MAQVGELERLVENLVNRGLVAPKFVGRQVGQSLINELNNLGRNVTTSQSIRENEKANKLSDFQSNIAKSIGQSQINRGVGTGSASLKNPFAISRTSSGRINIATPTSEGFKLQSLLADNPLAEFALKNSISPPPEANVETLGGTYKSLLDVRNALLKNTTDPSKITGYFQQLGA